MRITCLFVAALCAALSLSPSHAAVVYVNKNATGAVHDGKSWATAYTSVSDGVNLAKSGDEVWVAASTPAATAYYENVTIRTAIALYGGFSGVETQRNQRNWNANVTVIEGGISSESVEIVIDGFTVRNGSSGFTLLYSTATVANNTITGHLDTGVSAVSGRVTLANNNITGNGSHGVLIGSGSTTTLTNNTITGNAANGVYVYAGATVLSNNIVAYNGGYGIRDLNANISVFSHNDVFGNTGGNLSGRTIPSGPANLSLDPKLSNTYRDIHIQPDSPCRDAGDSAAVIGATDIDGQPRIQGASVDIGSDESDGTTWPVLPVAWRVSPTGNDANDGLTWQSAKRTISAALAVAQQTDEVWVAKGTYAGGLSPTARIALYGGFAGTETQRTQRDWKANPTILDGSGADTSGVSFTFSGALMDGFTVRNYNGHYAVVVGGAGTVSVTNNTITGNSAGVSIISAGSVTLANNTICGNGSGVDMGNGTVSLINNTISGNSGTGLYVYGGKAIVTNNIVAFGSYYGVKVGSPGSIPVFSHNDVYGNVAGDFSGYTPPTDLGNLALDPRLSNAYHDVHVQPDSPCRDAGDSAAVVGTLDIDGQPRIQGTSVDIGSDESDGTVWNVPSIAWHVSSTGNDSNSGLTWLTAKRTISAALAVAQQSDEVWVAKGTYRETITPKARIALYGGFAGTEKQRSQRDWKANPTVLDGSNSESYGVQCAFGNNVVDGFVLRFCGVLVLVGPATIANNTITGNDGAGVSISDTAAVMVTVANSTISANSAEGVRIYRGSAILYNNTITGNGTNGVGVASFSNETSAKAWLSNNIIAANGGYGISSTSSSIPTFSHNDVYGNVAGDFSGFTPPAGQGNLSLDPKLSNIYHDVHIQPTSPCRDAGDNAAVTGTLDIDGQPRIQGSSVDIGSDESNGTLWTVPSIAWHVSTTGNDASDGLTWRTAKKTIGAAVLVAQGGDKVWVARGTYREAVRLGAGVSLYGGYTGTDTLRTPRDWKANPTILDGGGANQYAAYCGFANSGVDGFTLVGGTTAGVGVKGSGAFVANNTISGNGLAGLHIAGGTASITGNTITANSGYGVYMNDGTATLTSNSVSNNGSTGLYLGAGTATLVNNTVAGNASTGVYSYFNGLLSLYNNVIAFNGKNGIVSSTKWGVTAYSHNSLFGNIAGSPSGYPMPAGEGNISVDPMFVDGANGNFRLQSGSPCIDAGDDGAVKAGETDADVKPRIMGLHVDIGAYEYDSTGPSPFAVADLKQALGIAGGLVAPSREVATRLNVDSGSARVDMRDAVRIARKVVGLEANP